MRGEKKTLLLDKKKAAIPLCNVAFPPQEDEKKKAETHIKINFASHPFSLRMMT